MKSLHTLVTRLAGLAVLSAALVFGQGLTTPAGAAEQVIQGGFEDAVGGNSPSWVEADSAFGSPLCDSGCGGVGPRSGTWWSWFGGTAAASTGSLTQSVTIPVGTASLSFYLWVSSAPAPNTATLNVKMDATVVQTFTNTVTDAGYVLRTFDIGAFADGGSHTLSFNYANPVVATGSPNFHLDDISITTGPPVMTGMPTVSSTTPAGPSSSTTPKVKGTAEAGSTVTLYSNATCTSAALGSGPAADFAGAGITATVPAQASTPIYAKATKAGQGDSACSTTFVTYVNDSTIPETTITSPTAGKVVKTLKVPVTFTSSEAGSTFTCKLDAGAFAACTSPASLTVTPGSHTVQVVAKDAAGNADATPASVTFTAYDCASLIAAQTAAQASVTAADTAVAKATKSLKKAKKSHNAAKIKKAKKKVKKAKAAQKAAQTALTTAQGAAAPCGGTVSKTDVRH